MPLNSEQRDQLPDSDFAFPGRRFPIHDEAHARDALARVSQSGTAEEKATVRAAVKKRYPNIGKTTAASQTIIIAASHPFSAPIKVTDLPTEIDGQPVEYREKEMIFCG